MGLARLKHYMSGKEDDLVPGTHEPIPLTLRDQLSSCPDPGSADVLPELTGAPAKHRPMPASPRN
jgi:hypothetical protein